MDIAVEDVWVSDDAGEGVVAGNVDGASTRQGGAVWESLRETSLAQTWLDKEGENKR